MYSDDQKEIYRKLWNIPGKKSFNASTQNIFINLIYIQIRLVIPKTKTEVTSYV